MTIYVALLRGINVGGKGALPMKALREMAEGCGFADVATYIQSGNVVFRSSEGAGAVARALRAAIAAAGGVDPAIAVRTRAQLAKVVAANPYVDRSDDDKQLHVTFAVEGARFSADPTIDLAAFAPEEVTIRPREVYLFLPGGIGRSKLAVELSKRKPADGTTRNWRTTTRLLAMADELA
jgi:uncharacterized protein (DUF1697 family)